MYANQTNVYGMDKTADFQNCILQAPFPETYTITVQHILSQMFLTIEGDYFNR